MIKKLFEKIKSLFKKKDCSVISFIYVKPIDKYYVIFSDGVIWNVLYENYPEWKKEALKNISVILEDTMDED